MIDDPGEGGRPAGRGHARGLARSLRSEYRLLSLLFAVASVPASVMVFAQPVWGRNDEPWHTDMIVQMVHGTYPVVGVTPITPVTLKLMEATGVFRWDSFASAAPNPEDATLLPARRDLSGTAKGVWVQRHIWQYSYEAIQPPLYYLLAAPAWLAGDWLKGPLGGVYAVRLFDVLLIGLMAPLTYLGARRVWPEERAPAIGSAIGLALVPGYLLNLSAVTNDSLVAVLGALCVLLAVRACRLGWDVPRAAVVGGVFGAAMLAKPTAIGLVPAIALAFLLPRPGGSAGRRLALGGIAAAVAVATQVPLALINLRLYGALSSLGAGQVLNTALTPTAISVASVVVNTVHAFATFWVGEPLEFTIPSGRLLLLVVAVLIAVSWIGVGRLLQRSSANRPELLTVLVAAVGCGVVAVALPYASHNNFLSPGRYAYPALSSVAVLVATGLFALIGKHRSRVAVAALFAATALLTLAFDVRGIVPPQTVGAMAPVAASFETTATGSAGVGHLVVAVDALERDSAGIWIHVTAVNHGSRPAEWSPVPSLFEGRAWISTAYYPGSAHLPERLDSGRTIRGWLLFPRPSRNVRGSSGLRLVFPDIAVDDYAIVRTVNVAVRWGTRWR